MTYDLRMDTTPINVSVLKSKLLEIIREVEQGKGYSITKSGKQVALLLPVTEKSLPILGFARDIKLEGDIENLRLDEGWTFDEVNLPIEKLDGKK